MRSAEGPDRINKINRIEDREAKDILLIACWIKMQRDARDTRTTLPLSSLHFCVIPSFPHFELRTPHCFLILLILQSCLVFRLSALRTTVAFNLESMT